MMMFDVNLIWNHRRRPISINCHLHRRAFWLTFNRSIQRRRPVQRNDNVEVIIKNFFCKYYGKTKSNRSREMMILNFVLVVGLSMALEMKLHFREQTCLYHQFKTGEILGFHFEVIVRKFCLLLLFFADDF